MLSEALEEVSEQLITSPEPEPEPKNRGGRPVGAKTRPPDPGFFDRLKDLDWEKHLLYLYRLQPLVDRTSGGDPKYILKYSEAIDEDRVMQDHGSGVYQVRLTKSKDGAAKTNEVERHTFEIFNIKYPPQIPVGVWLDDHRNERWKGFKEIMQSPPPEQRNGPPAQDVGKLVQTIGKELRDGQVDPTKQFEAQTAAYQTGLRQGIETGKSAAPASDESKLLETLLPLLLRPAPTQDNSVVQVLTLQLEAEREQRKADREQARSDREAADRRADAAEKRHDALMTGLLAKKEDTGLDVMEKFTKMFSAFQSLSAGGLGATDDSWTGIFKEGIREAAPDLMRTLAPAAAGILGGLGQGAPRQVPPPSVSRETLSPNLPPTSTGVAPPAAQQPPPFDPQFRDAYTCIFMSQGAILNHMRAGKSGLDFGDWLAEGPGELEIEKLKAAGPENLIKFIASQIPAFWGELQPVQLKFQGFLGELMAWSANEEEPVGGNNSESVSRETLVENLPGTSNARAKAAKKTAGGKAS